MNRRLIDCLIVLCSLDDRMSEWVDGLLMLSVAALHNVIVILMGRGCRWVRSSGSTQRRASTWDAHREPIQRISLLFDTSIIAFQSSSDTQGWIEKLSMCRDRIKNVPWHCFAPASIWCSFWLVKYGGCITSCNSKGGTRRRHREIVRTTS